MAAGAPGFNPLHCGAVVASGRSVCTSAPPAEFQSPSLRGSGRFARRKAGGQRRKKSFNPLHCGAVVASNAPVGVAIEVIERFNPLHCGAVVASASEAQLLSELKGFNPLHCGAVVASEVPPCRGIGGRSFQSPSLRGSGRFGRAPQRDVGAPRPFQSPSLRGSGRFRREARGEGRRRGLFNPLHCGAVVASSRHGPGEGPAAPAFQSPSLRGSGRFNRRGAEEAREAEAFQSPSLRGSGRFGRGLRGPPRPIHFSIPFIAGQWSLLEGSGGPP